MLEDKNFTPTSLDNLGEIGLIEHLTKNFKIQNDSTQTGIGDDAASIHSKKELLISSEIFTEGVHFNLSYVPLKHLGYKMVVAAISDIYAMNGNANQILVNLAASNRFGLEAIDELYSGIKTACSNYQLDLVGGDTTSSASGLVVSITAVGDVESNNKTLRKGAKENDVLVVSGDLGAAYLGLQVLARENEVWKVNPENQPDLSKYSYLIQRQLKPEARKDVVQLLKELDVHPTCMMDLSDGLAADALQMAHANNLGLRIYEDKVPMDATLITTAEEFKIHPIVPVLNGGEDYELLFAMDLADVEKIKGNPNLTIIGHFTTKDDGKYLVGSGNESVLPLTSPAWEKYEAYLSEMKKEK